MLNHLDIIALFLAAFFVLWILTSLLTAARQIVAELYIIKTEIGGMTTDIQALREKYAPIRLDYRG